MSVKMAANGIRTYACTNQETVPWIEVAAILDRRTSQFRVD